MRIVGGLWRGRALAAPPGHATRPTADRVRQALFDMMLHAPWGGPELLEGATVLDAFAGTGALGLEALSRGAARAVFIENDAAALVALRANIAACRAETLIRVIDGDALRPPPSSEACGLVFLDPPYAGTSETGPESGSEFPLPLGKGNSIISISTALGALTHAGWIARGALIVAETARAAPCPSPVALAERVHGAARITVWRGGSEVAPAG